MVLWDANIEISDYRANLESTSNTNVIGYITYISNIRCVYWLVKRY